MSDTLPIIDAPNVQFTVEIQDDGFGLRFGLDNRIDREWVHVSMISLNEMKPSHIERDMDGNGDFPAYYLAMVDAEEFISKLRIFLAAYDALNAAKKG